MAAGQGWGNAGGGGFLRILGIVYLIKQIRKRRRNAGNARKPETPQNADQDLRAAP
jgi:hypothetical protein